MTYNFGTAAQSALLLSLNRPAEQFGYLNINQQKNFPVGTNELISNSFMTNHTKCFERQTSRSADQLNSIGIGYSFLSPISTTLEENYLLPLNVRNLEYQNMAQTSRNMLQRYH